MRRRFWVTLAYVGVLGLVAVSGLGCGGLFYGTSSTVSRAPTTESEFTSYITPDCPSVKEVLQGIVGLPPYELSQAGFDAIRNWVANNIRYASDQERWGGDHWQTPEETLMYRTGDCEDFSILLCSLLRAYGIDAERVYVALGTDGGDDGHAFLIEDWYSNGDWRRLESQASAQLSSYAWRWGLRSHPDATLDKYEITEVFNDLHYCQDGAESFSWGNDQDNSSTVTRITNALGYIVRLLSRCTRYLLGLLFD